MRIEVYRQTKGSRYVWDLYINHRFRLRFDRACDAKRIAMRQASGLGKWHRRNRTSHYPIRYWVEIVP
jgi:hypothetical protein